jgi:hypothetical protein
MEERGSIASAKRPLNRTDKNGEPLSEKKLRRLEKNRLSARECRRRKREATEDMQRQINLLEGENLRLRLQLQVGSGCLVFISFPSPILDLNSLFLIVSKTQNSTRCLDWRRSGEK